jgi:hypothetical protein
MVDELPYLVTTPTSKKHTTLKKAAHADVPWQKKSIIQEEEAFEFRRRRRRWSTRYYLVACSK